MFLYLKASTYFEYLLSHMHQIYIMKILYVQCIRKYSYYSTSSEFCSVYVIFAYTYYFTLYGAYMYMNYV